MEGFIDFKWSKIDHLGGEGICEKEFGTRAF